MATEELTMELEEEGGREVGGKAELELGTEAMKRSAGWSREGREELLEREEKELVKGK